MIAWLLVPLIAIATIAIVYVLRAAPDAVKARRLRRSVDAYQRSLVKRREEEEASKARAEIVKRLSTIPQAAINPEPMFVQPVMMPTSLNGYSVTAKPVHVHEWGPQESDGTRRCHCGMRTVPPVKFDVQMVQGDPALPLPLQPQLPSEPSPMRRALIEKDAYEKIRESDEYFYSKPITREDQLRALKRATEKQYRRLSDIRRQQQGKRGS